jgi:hypothetical protein
VKEWKNDMAYHFAYDKHGKMIGLSNYKEKNIGVYDVGGTLGVKDIVSDFLLLPQSHQTVLQNVFNFRYFHFLCEELYKVGYKDHHSLYGIPYDFRLVLDPSYRKELFDTFQTIIQNAKHEMRGKKVIIVAHSLGVIMMKWFLSTHVTEPWIHEHIERIVGISPPFGGAMFALRAVLCGDYYVPVFHNVFKDEIQRNSGIVMCLPNEHAYDTNVPLITTPNGEFTIKSYDTFADNKHVSFQMYRDLYKPHMNTIYTPLSIPTNIVIATNLPTPREYISKEFEKYPHNVLYGNGDGVVDEKSLQRCESVFDKNLTRTMIFPDQDHTSIMNDPRVIHMLKHYAL